MTAQRGAAGGGYKVSSNSVRAILELPALARDQDWVLDIGSPDFFGDVRMTATSSIGDQIKMAFASDGKLAGAYFFPRGSSKATWHIESVAGVREWLTNLNGEIDG